ncbi:hypothetical protein EVAR_79757_1 [Eumeta japonica]|uniref:Uncharacterized protein n=1 Tax=Eumeta variegata TaxID=151549 RepID=A0A4C1TAC5_EUMVA|nr:hypothetical protein EVAR_79757_1 [Eumeta japonica]
MTDQPNLLTPKKSVWGAPKEVFTSIKKYSSKMHPPENNCAGAHEICFIFERERARVCGCMHLCVLSESFGDSLSCPPPNSLSNKYPIPTQEVCNERVTPPELRLSMGGGPCFVLLDSKVCAIAIAIGACTCCITFLDRLLLRLTLPQPFNLTLKDRDLRPPHSADAAREQLTTVVIDATTNSATKGSSYPPRHGASCLIRLESKTHWSIRP